MKLRKMKNSRTIEENLRDIRQADLVEWRDAASSSPADKTAVVVPLRGSKPTCSAEEMRWDSDELTVMWPSSRSDRRD